MGLETGSYIDDLNEAWPLGADTKNFGDDHLRLIKTIIKNSFSGATGIVVGYGSSNPTANEDSGDGYVVGSLYVNTTSGAVFKCTDNTATAAVWVELEPPDADTLLADVGDTLTAGFLSDTYARGTVSSGTVTPAPGTGEENFQTYTNNGAHTLAPPASNCTVVIAITNGASAGAITTSGFTQVTGDSFDTTNGNDFMCYITKCGTFSLLNVVALQ